MLRRGRPRGRRRRPARSVAAPKALGSSRCWTGRFLFRPGGRHAVGWSITQPSLRRPPCLPTSSCSGDTDRLFARMGRADRCRPARHMARIACSLQGRRARASTGPSSGTSAKSTTSTGCSTAGVRQVAEGSPWPRYAVRACIVCTDEQFGLVRMYQAIGASEDRRPRHRRARPPDAAAFIARERVRLGIAI